MKVRITRDAQGLQTKVLLVDGSDLAQSLPIASIVIEPLLPNKPILAHVMVIMPGLDIDAHAILSRESLEEAAAHYGLKLVPMEE